jgi:PE family
MPFLQVDQSNDPLGKIGSALPPATLFVHPDQVLHLKHRLEARRLKIRDFMLAEGDKLVSVPPPGTDPCSARVADALGQNGETAVEALQGFADQLDNAINSLDEAARMYGLLEESNIDRFRQEPA